MTALDAGLRGPLGATTVAPSRRAVTTLVPRVAPAVERRRLWERRYAWRLRITDFAIVIAVSLVTAIIAHSSSTILGTLRIESVAVSVWLLMLWLGRSRSPRIMGEGSDEYKRVAHSTGFTFGALALLFIAFQWQDLRPQLIVALPVGFVLLLAGRWGWRKWLVGQRAYGHYSPRTIVTGTAEDIEYVIRTLRRTRAKAFTIAGVAPSDGAVEPFVVDGILYEVVGDMASVAQHARVLEADSVIVAGRPADDGEFLRRLSWELEGTASELIISSRIADVAGPRVSLRPVEGLPLVSVQLPHFDGGKHNLKRAMDLTLGVVALIPVALVFPFIALAIRIDSRGPIFFRQTRIGRDGREFRMVKFRTMGVDAEERLAALQQGNEGNGLLFKMKSDPRVTRVGAVLRKFSLDELPQFWNVLRGDMSIVGPRPPLPQEVVGYDGTVSRRLFIKPGITGPWQVGGRSDLSWEDSVRLDLRYVESWSITDDFRIMWRTAAVMFAPRGAY